MYIDATLLGGGNSIELRGDELWDVTMFPEEDERLVGKVHCSHHVPFVRETLVFINERYYEKDNEDIPSLISILCKLIDWYNYSE